MNDNFPFVSFFHKFPLFFKALHNASLKICILFPCFCPHGQITSNAWELERDDLKGVAKITKKGELHGRIDHKNEEIDILKIGLSGIAKRYGYGNVQEFYKIYHKSHSAYTAYKEQEAKWEKIYGTDSQKQDKESILERLRNPPKVTTEYQQQKTGKSNDRGAR